MTSFMHDDDTPATLREPQRAHSGEVPTARPVESGADAKPLPVEDGTGAGRGRASGTASEELRTPTSAQSGGSRGRFGIVLALLLAAGSITASVLLWQRTRDLPEQIARSHADFGVQVQAVRSLSQDGHALASSTAQRLVVLDARLEELGQQRAQLEELVRRLAVTRDESLVADLDAALRLAMQQFQLTGSTAALVQTMQSAQRRVARAGQSRLEAVQRALERDLQHIASLPVVDTAAMLVQLDDLIQAIDVLPLAAAGATATAEQALPAADAMTTGTEDAVMSAHSAERGSAAAVWVSLQQSLGRMGTAVLAQLRDLVRITRIEHPEAALLSPQQGFFLRENLKLRLLNARLVMLSQRHILAASGLQRVQEEMEKYFDPASPRVRRSVQLLAQMQRQLRDAQTPSIQATLLALGEAAAQSASD